MGKVGHPSRTPSRQQASLTPLALRAPEKAKAASTSPLGSASAPMAPRDLPRTAAPRAESTGGVGQKLASCFGHMPKAAAAAVAGAAMTAMVVGTPVAAQEVPFSGSILNPAGIDNPSGASPLFRGTRIGQPADRTVVVTPSEVNPTEHMARGGGPAEIRRIVNQGVDAPRTAEAVAAKLAELYGPFNASNSEENRRAIIESLRWIAGTGIDYDHGRASANENDTHSPNHTLSTQSGVCRDTHTATAAILASLMNARKDGDTWVPGSPSGQEANVQVVNFATPKEHHAFMVYRDPGSNGWDALEYGKSYDLDAPNAPSAARALPNHMPGYSIYRLTGWDSEPIIADRRVVDAAAARAFFTENPGLGEKGEVRVRGSADGGQITTFVSDQMAVSGAIQRNASGGLDGGIKLNYHEDLSDAGGTGYARLAGGVWSSGIEPSDTGIRGVEHREPLRTYMVAVKYDRRYQTQARELVGEHLRYRYGSDIDAMIGVPFGPEGVVAGAIQDYSSMEFGIDGALLGREQLSPRLTLDWALQARYEVDVLEAAQELMTSKGRSFDAVGTDALRADFALALTHESDSGLITRFEAGGTQWLASPLDPEVVPTGSHYAVLTVAPESGNMEFGVLARGRSLASEFVPVDSFGVALRYTPSDRLSLGVSVDSVFPGGDTSKFGDNIQVMGNLSYRF